MSLYNLIELKTFNIFPEYFLGISALYMLIVIVLISYNVFGLIIQKSISDCIGLIMLLACYLIINDDLLFWSTDFGLHTFLGFYKSVILDCFGGVTKFIVCFFSAIYFFLIADFLKEYKLTSFEYLVLLFFAVLGLLLLCTSNDLLSAYLAIELVSLSSYLLASFKKASSYSVEAGIKYLITGSISSAFFLLGSSFIYASIGTIYISDFWSLFRDNPWLAEQNQFKLWQEMCILSDAGPTKDYLDNIILFKNMSWEAYNFLDYVIKSMESQKFFDNLAVISECSDFLEPFIEIGLSFIIFSLFIKLALAPFHLWSLDVYEGSPTISTFFFSVITKLSIFVFLTRICYSTISFKDSWQFYAIFVSILSIFVGSFGGLRQKKLKTLLAYSSISHMGYVLLSFSTATQFGIEMFIFYLVVYMLSGIAMWFIILSARENKKYYTNKFNRELGDFALLRKSNPALAVSLSLAMFSIAGIPPLIGFFAKLGIFLSILYVEYYVVALLAVLCSVVSTFYYIRIIKILYFENLLVGKLYYPIKTNKIIFFTASIFALFFLFVNPTLMYLVIHNAVWQSCLFVSL